MLTAEPGTMLIRIAITAGVLALLAPPPAHAESRPIPRYPLPANKIHIETCQNQALRLHPGIIDELRTVPHAKTFWTRYQIIMPDGAEWSVTCDLGTGEIIDDRALATPAPGRHNARP